MNKNSHGGKRPNAGRKKGIETKTISFRVDADKAEILNRLVSRYIKKMNINIGNLEGIGVQYGIIDGELMGLYKSTDFKGNDNSEWLPISNFLNTYL